MFILQSPEFVEELSHPELEGEQFLKAIYEVPFMIVGWRNPIQSMLSFLPLPFHLRLQTNFLWQPFLNIKKAA
ncbi:hypothetical protein [Oscillibacter sp. GMB15532]|uniref:hypothetical protein n=1 Tax=Oscillibacter sp. GMB15532 TaxID=3230022 RepID=UPI0034DEDA12